MKPMETGGKMNSRLMITHITVENFKSYYGKQDIGPFHHNFTAVVGPNGSGKSNVIDSLLFVFGYRAGKIRSKKLSLLIHSSAGHENLSSCSVDVHFQMITDEEDGSFRPVPGSQFVVSRTATRDNKSDYFFNGQRKQFKEIGTLLNDVGIDLVHNRFLILQGEVEQIAVMKPKALNENEEGMLEYLEDIIGSSRLKAPIEELSVQIEQLMEERSAQLARVRSAESEKDDMEAPVREVVEYLKLENKLTHLKNQFFQLQQHQFATELETTIEPQIAEKSQEMDAAQANLTEIAESQKNKQIMHKKLQKEYDDIVERETKIEESLNELNQLDEKVRADIKRGRDKVAKLKIDIKAEERKLNEMRGKPDRAKKEVVRLETVVEESDEAIRISQTKIDEKLEELHASTADAQQQKRKHEELLADFVIAEDNASSQLTLAQDALQLLMREEGKERQKVIDLERALEDATNKLTDSTRQSQVAQAALPTVEAELIDSKNRLRVLRDEETQLNATIREQRNKYEELQQNIVQSRSQSALINRLMDEKRSGRIPGIYGRLGDLGAIDEKYDVAISTTCQQLDNVVVDTIETAQQCINFLKRENLGIATFIALDKQERMMHQMRQHINTPENVPRLFDLIKVADNTVLPAFYFALRDTLIVDTIARATAIGIGGERRWRVVTLKGELVDVSGAMTGGGTATRRGRIGQKVLVDTSGDKQKDADEARRAYEQAQQRVDVVRQQANEIEADCGRKSAEVERLRRTIAGLAHEITATEQSVTRLQPLLAEQRQKAEQAGADEQTLNNARSKVTQAEQARDRSTATAEEVRIKVRRVEEEIREIEDRLVGTFRRQLDAAQRTKANAEKEIAKERAAVTGAERLCKKSMARIAELENDCKETELVVQNGDRKMKEHVEMAEKRIEEKESITEAKAIAKANLDDALKLHSNLDDDELRVSRLVEQLKRDVTKLKATQATLKHKINALTTELAKLKLNPIAELELGGDLAHQNVNRQPDALDETVAPDNRTSIGSTTPDRSTMMDTDGGDDEMIVAEGTGSDVALPLYEKDVIAGWDEVTLTRKLTTLEQRIGGYKVPNINIIVEYKRKLVKYKQLVSELDAISTRREEQRRQHDKLRKQRLNEFMDGFTKIGCALKEMYQMITLGGDASLELVDSLDPFSEGVSFGVRPPKKSWKQISNLSGGEKTLSSLALVFALHHYKPTPLYVMDEIDAALDFRNVSIIAHYIKERTKNAQFIIISLRNNMFELGNRLVGIYKTNDCTHHVAIDPDRIGLGAAAPATKIVDDRQPDQAVINDEDDGAQQQQLLPDNHDAAAADVVTTSSSAEISADSS